MLQCLMTAAVALHHWQLSYCPEQCHFNYSNLYYNVYILSEKDGNMHLYSKKKYAEKLLTKKE